MQVMFFPQESRSECWRRRIIMQLVHCWAEATMLWVLSVKAGISVHSVSTNVIVGVKYVLRSEFYNFSRFKIQEDKSNNM